MREYCFYPFLFCVLLLFVLCVCVCVCVWRGGGGGGVVVFFPLHKNISDADILNTDPGVLLL